MKTKFNRKFKAYVVENCYGDVLMSHYNSKDPMPRWVNPATDELLSSHKQYNFLPEIFPNEQRALDAVKIIEEWYPSGEYKVKTLKMEVL